MFKEILDLFWFNNLITPFSYFIINLGVAHLSITYLYRKFGDDLLLIMLIYFILFMLGFAILFIK